MAILDITTYAGPYPSGWGLLDDDAQTINDADTSTLPQARITALKMYETAGAAGGVTDDDAIHDNVAAEISAITEKATPISADLIVIEDSAAANAKKKVQIGNLPGGGAATKKCRARPAADLTGVNAATYVIPFDSEDFDEGAWHDNVTNNTRFTVPASAADKVDIVAYARVTSVTAGVPVRVQILKDGAFYRSSDGSEPVNNIIQNQLVLLDEECVPGTTYYEMRISGGDTSVNVETETEFTIRESA